MSEISPSEIQSAAESGWTIAGIIGTAFAAISAGFWKIHRVIRRFEVASQDIDALKVAEVARQAREAKIDALLDILVTSKADTDKRLAAIEHKMPDGVMMDQDGVWAVFGRQQEALGKVEESIRRDMSKQYDGIRDDLRTLNTNLMTLVARDPRSRPGDV